MGRYPSIAADKQKTGAARGKLYAMYAKEIYSAAKKSTNVDANPTLKRLIEKAKKAEVPSDIINRAIDKVNSGVNEDYDSLRYEGFGPGASTFIIKTLTDNVNRTVGEIRAAFNKVHKSLGVTNSVSYNYDYLAIISFKSNEEEKIFEELLNAGIEILDLESNDGEITITANPKDINKVKEELEKIIPGIEYTYDEVGMFAKEEVTLTGEDKEIYDKLYNLLDAIDDVSAIYTNVKLD